MADDAVHEGLVSRYREHAETMTYLKRAKLLRQIWDRLGTHGAVAKSCKVKTQVVEQHLVLANATAEVQRLVQDGKVSPTHAIQLIRQERRGGRPAQELLRMAIAKATAEGRTQATPKDLDRKQWDLPPRKRLRTMVQRLDGVAAQATRLLEEGRFEDRKRTGIYVTEEEARLLSELVLVSKEPGQ